MNNSDGSLSEKKTENSILIFTKSLTVGIVLQFFFEIMYLSVCFEFLDTIITQALLFWGQN